MLKPTHKLTPHRINHHLKSMHELVRITADFSQMGIDYIVLKGIPLNKLLYKDQLVRSSRDIDILIQIKDIQRVHQYLIADGYQLESSVSIADLTQEPSCLTQYLDEILYRHPHKKIALDIKWHISTMNCFGMSWCNLENHDVIAIRGHNIRILNPEQNFYYLCNHAAKHDWEFAQWLEDLNVLSQKVSLRWGRVVSLAQATKTIRPLLEASLLLQQHHALQLQSIPHSFWDKLVVNTRLAVIQSKWFERWTTTPKSKGYLSAIMGLFLYPTLFQKYHYTKRLFVLRVASLRQISRFKSPKPYKMILFSLLPDWRKSNRERP